MAVGWLGAAVLAVLVGLGAISVIGNGLTSPETRPLSAAEVADELARQIAVSPPASAGAGERPSPSPSSAVATRTFPTRAGTVVGRCVGTRPEVVSMSPRQGYELHEQDRGPQEDDAEGEFRGQDDRNDRVKFEIVCPGGVPTLVGDHDD